MNSRGAAQRMESVARASEVVFACLWVKGKTISPWFSMRMCGLGFKVFSVLPICSVCDSRQPPLVCAFTMPGQCFKSLHIPTILSMAVP